MKQKTFYTIGLMSGTSLDGLDICYASFELENNIWQFKILKTETITYPSIWENKLRNAINIESQELLQLNSDYGFYLGEKVQEFIAQNQITTIDLIASHGHTIFHQPQKKFTLQIGDGRAIKIKTGIATVYDFRSQDVLMNGNGAPLVPIGDQLLFSDYDACLNLGGFSNISLNRDGKRIAFDICPVNIILNDLASKIGEKYDKDGVIAKNGIIDHQLLNQLNQIDFYHQEPPKSLGIEWINSNINPLITNQKTEDLIATFTEHAAQQISKIIKKYNIKNVLVTGGGAYNKFLIEKLKANNKAEILIPAKEIVEFKEALIFAFMGLLRFLDLNNVLSSATGSSKNHSSGLIC